MVNSCAAKESLNLYRVGNCALRVVLGAKLSPNWQAVLERPNCLAYLWLRRRTELPFTS
jgi:hypothetical protein